MHNIYDFKGDQDLSPDQSSFLTENIKCSLLISEGDWQIAEILKLIWCFFVTWILFVWLPCDSWANLLHESQLMGGNYSHFRWEHSSFSSPEISEYKHFIYLGHDWELYPVDEVCVRKFTWVKIYLTCWSLSLGSLSGVILAIGKSWGLSLQIWLSRRLSPSVSFTVSDSSSLKSEITHLTAR